MAYARPAELAEELRRDRFDQAEQNRAERCLDAATAEIDEWVDWPDGVPNPDTWTQAQRQLVKTVCLSRAVEHWKAADAAFGAIGFSDIGVLRAPREGFLRHGMDLIPVKAQWGIC